MLHLLGADRDETGWDRAKLVGLLRAQQQPEQRRHFAFLLDDSKGYYAELENAFFCIGSLAALGETVPDPEAAIGYLQDKQKKNGAFAKGLTKEQSYSEEQASFAVVKSLRLLRADLPYRQAGISRIQSWQIADGGFDAFQSQHQDMTPQISNLFNIARATLTLYLLSTKPLDQDRCRQRLGQLWVPANGYFLNVPKAIPVKPFVETLPATCLGLFAMAALNMYEPAAFHLSDLVPYVTG
jgi:hypothetical protein